MPRKDTYSGPISAQAQQELVSEGIENFELPKSVVMKIAKSSIPDNMKLQKETVISLVKGSTVFINYLAATAHDVALSKQHKSISASDVLKALETIEFGDMVNKLHDELQIFREVEKNKGKGSSSNGASSSSRKGNGGAASASAPTRGSKGKEKATASASTGNGNPLPSPFTSTPLDIYAVHPRVSELSGAGVTSAGAPMDVDDDEETSVSAAASRVLGDEEEDPEEVVADQEREDEVIESDEEQSEEELEDTVALEEDELRKDALGVEERSAAMQDED